MQIIDNAFIDATSATVLIDIYALGGTPILVDGNGILDSVDNGVLALSDGWFYTEPETPVTPTDDSGFFIVLSRMVV